jgi:hypothetical protein
MRDILNLIVFFNFDLNVLELKIYSLLFSSQLSIFYFFFFILFLSINLKNLSQKGYVIDNAKNVVLVLSDLSFSLVFENFILSLGSFSNDEIFLFYLISAFFTVVVIFIFIKDQNIPEVNNFCLRIQKFCFENQVLIFSLVTLLIFTISLLEMSFFGSLVGLTLILNGMRFFYVLHKENIFYVEGIIFAMVCYRYATNPGYLNTVLCLIFLWYLWSVASLVLPLPDLEEAYIQFQEKQKPSVLHMKTEFILFFLLERVVFVYMTLRFSVGGDTLCSALGSDLHVILSYYMSASFAVCVLARLITTVVFNPLTDKQLQLATACFSCGSLMFSACSYNSDIYSKAVTGGSTTPVPSALTAFHQRNTFFCRAATAEEVDAAKMFVAVYNTKPPTLPGTDRISLEETLIMFKEETRPTYVERIYRHRGVTPGPSPKLTEEQIISAVKKALNSGSSDLAREQALTEALKKALNEQQESCAPTNSSSSQPNQGVPLQKNFGGVGKLRIPSRQNTKVLFPRL